MKRFMAMAIGVGGSWMNTAEAYNVTMDQCWHDPTALEQTMRTMAWLSQKERRLLRTTSRELREQEEDAWKTIRQLPI